MEPDDLEGKRVKENTVKYVSFLRTKKMVAPLPPPATAPQGRVLSEQGRFSPNIHAQSNSKAECEIHLNTSTNYTESSPQLTSEADKSHSEHPPLDP